MMKKISYLAIPLLLLITIVSCKKLLSKVFGGVDVDIPAFQLTVPAFPIVPSGEMSMGSFTAHINLDSAIRAKTDGVFGIGVVSSIKVKQIVIGVNNPDDMNNFSNFQTGRVTLSSNSNSTPIDFYNFTFPDVYSASQTITPADSPELLPYLKGSEIIYTMYGKARRPTTKALNMTFNVTVRVK